MRREGFTAAILVYSRDVFYYSGTAQPCNLLVTPSHGPVLFVRRALDFVQKESSLPDIVEGRRFEDIKQLLDQWKLDAGVLGLEEDVIPAAMYVKASQLFHQMQIRNISPLILQQRMLKDEEEVRLIRKACSLFDNAHRVVMETLEPGVTELELANEVMRKIRGSGHDGTLFFRRWDAVLPAESILTSGSNLTKISGHAMTITGTGTSNALAWGPSNRRIRKGDMVVWDIGVNYRGYHGDAARTYVVGKATRKQKEIFDKLKRVQEAAFKSMRPGTRSSEVYFAAKREAEKCALPDFFMGYGKHKGEYVGHGLGLEVDEPPVLDSNTKTPLRKNMILTAEPKFIIPRWGSMMIEDTVLLKDESVERLTRLERELFEVT